ncbi:MAG TPA: ComEC/Rec2 family competence protein [Solirubrobacterales bacterium]
MRERLPSPLLLFGIVILVALALPRAGQIRERASASLGRGMPAREAELARGFVIGEDERIDPGTVEDFRRAGLSHLLAVSGQNVVLLALLALPVLAAFGIPLRARLVWVLGLIAIYVPIAGAGPSIQRAGVMGALGVLATLAGRRASRFYALLVAAGVTLAVDPDVAGDVGWQLSFAAVLGILWLATPLREAIVSRIGSRGWRRALAEGAAVTVAATLATAPLIAFHFEEISTTTLFANLLALPAVAPAMWLGMVSAAAGQAPGFPVEIVNSVNALLLAYIAQVAAWCGRPSWAVIHLHMSASVLIATYVGLAGGVIATMRLGHRRRLTALRRPLADGPKTGYAGPFSSRRRALLGILAVAGICLAVVMPAWSGAGQAAPPASGLRIEVLDVGQGDSILLQPPDAPPVLVDGGPPGDGLAAKLRAEGVDSLGAAVVTHDQSDHAGGIVELLGQMPIHRFVYAYVGRDLLAEARSDGATPERVAAGSVLRSGGLGLEVLWPSRALFSEPLGGADPNQRALVILARWRRFSMLLTADAEAESVPIDPGPIDVLKVAHHGSEDAGLDALLDRTDPKLALISVGEDNPYGHPTPATLATLAAHHIRTLRTDLDGTVTLEVDRGSVEVTTG